MQDGTLGRKIEIKPGSHAFVKLNSDEGFIRVALKGTDFGQACGHPHLARGVPVLYAGEMEFGREKGHLVRWSNMSGTYRCAEEDAFQAGLRLDNFWVVKCPDELLNPLNEQEYATTPGGSILQSPFPAIIEV